MADNVHGVALVWRNQGVLKVQGAYEPALLSAWIDTRTNHHYVPRWVVDDLFRSADRERLRAAGDPLPSVGPFTLYRGVSGRGRARRVRGISWTSSLEKAIWFAHRFASLGDPAVFRLVVAARKT